MLGSSFRYAYAPCGPRRIGVVFLLTYSYRRASFASLFTIHSGALIKLRQELKWQMKILKLPTTTPLVKCGTLARCVRARAA